MGQYKSKLPCIATAISTEEMEEERINDSNTTSGGTNNLIRTTTYQVLNADDHLGSESLSSGAGEVWVANVEIDEISQRWVDNYSKSNSSIDFFISHTWEDDGSSKGMPTNKNNGELVATWEDPRSLEEFGWRKSVAFQNVVRTITEMKGELFGDRDNLSFWVDKVCIPQYNEELKIKCIRSLEKFISKSHGLIVFLTPRYPKRLWCVYEVACFLSSKNLSMVFVNFRSFCCKKNINIYIELIRSFSIDNCECKEEYDRTILEQKVKQYYKSKYHFGSFVQNALSALIIRDMFSYPPMIKTKELYDDYIGPWMRLLNEVNDLNALHKEFSSFDVVKEYESVNYDDDKYIKKLSNHLEKNVYPLLDVMRSEACTEEGISLYYNGTNIAEK